MTSVLGEVQHWSSPHLLNAAEYLISTLIVINASIHINAAHAGESMSIYLIDRTTGSLEVLICIYMYGPTSKTRLAEILRPTMETLSRAIRILEELNLVTTDVEEDFPYRHICSLTSWGSELVQTPIFEWPKVFWHETGTRLLTAETVRVKEG